MGNIEYANHQLVVSELENLMMALKAILALKDSGVVINGAISYIVLLTLEGVRYTNKYGSETIGYNFKGALESTRARLKPTNLTVNELIEKMRKLNEDSYGYFASLCSPTIRRLLPTLINNLGITFCDEMMIDNTFLDLMNNKKMIFYNSAADSQRMIEKAYEVGKTLRLTIAENGGDFCKDPLQFDCKTSYEDYNVFCGKGPFGSSDRIELKLILLNYLCAINYCERVFLRQKICDSLKYRLAYIVYNKTFVEIAKINTDLPEVFMGESSALICKYGKLNRKEFRNCMFHYDMAQEIEQYDFDSEEMYLGAIKSKLAMNEAEFKLLLRNYFLDARRMLEHVCFSIAGDE